MRISQLPKECQECDKLHCLHIYMDGSADYSCTNPACEHRSAYKEAIRKAREEDERNN